MNSIERVLCTLVCDVPDRVPIDYTANARIHGAIAAHFGCRPDDELGIRRALGCDMVSVNPAYIGKPLFAPSQDPDIHIDPVSGAHTRWAAHESGGYWDYCDFPLKDADTETYANWPMPDPDQFDYEGCAPFFKDAADLAIYYGHAGICDIINVTGLVRSMEGTLIDLITEDEGFAAYTARRTAFQLGVMERMLDRYRDRISFVMMGEDLGTQIGPMISLELYRRALKPYHKKFCDLAHAYGKPVLFHSCGSSSWVFEDLIEIGVNAVDTLQPEAANMQPRYLKERFGGRLAFHGCISTAGPLAYGTREEVVRNCRETMEIMMPNGGYMFAPTHAIQDNSPLENVLAAYQTAATYGVYR